MLMKRKGTGRVDKGKSDLDQAKKVVFSGEVQYTQQDLLKPPPHTHTHLQKKIFGRRSTMVCGMISVIYKAELVMRSKHYVGISCHLSTVVF